MLAEKDPRVHAVDVLCYEFGAPRKRTHDSIVIALRMLHLAGAHPSSEQICLTLFQTTDKSCTFRVSHPRVEDAVKSSKQTVLERPAAVVYAAAYLFRERSRVHSLIGNGY